MRPSKDVRDVKLKSLKKRWKEKAFAAGVNREEVEAATLDFSEACFDGGLELRFRLEDAHLLADPAVREVGLLRLDLRARHLLGGDILEGLIVLGG